MISVTPRFRGLALIAVLLAAGVTSGCGTAQSRFADHLRQAHSYLDAGKNDKARVEVYNALRINPKSAEANYLIGLVSERLGNYVDAYKFYLNAAELDPNYLPGVAALGRAYVYSGAPAKALDAIGPALAAHPDDVHLLTVRGSARGAQGDLPAAMVDAERAVQLAPNDEDAIGLLAGLAQREGDTDRAISLLTAAIKRMPSSTAFREVLVAQYLSTGKLVEAEGELRKLIELQPAVIAPRLHLASFLINTRRADDAQQVLEEMLRHFPKSTEAKTAFADFLVKQRTRAQGEPVLRRLIAADPDNPDLRLALGDMLQRADATPDAEGVYRELIAKAPDSPGAVKARVRLAANDALGGRADEARAELEKVLHVDPQNADALSLRGTLRLENHEAASAIEDFRAVLRNQPDSVGLRRSLARAFSENGQASLAEEQLRTAVQTAPTDSGARVDLARLLGSSGRASAAVQLLEEGVRKAPSDLTLRTALVGADLAAGDLASARRALADLDTLAPDAPVGTLLAAHVAEQSGQLATAMADYEKLLTRDPGNIEALTAITKLDLNRGAGTAALARVRAAVATEPRNPYRRNLLGETLTATKAYPEAIEVLTALVKATPTWTIAYRNLAVARALSGDLPGAIATYDAALRIAPLEVPLTYELAGLYERAGRYDDAIARYDALQARLPQLSIPAANLAVLLVDHRSDARSLHRALDLTASFATSSDPVLLDACGWVREKWEEAGKEDATGTQGEPSGVAEASGVGEAAGLGEAGGAAETSGALALLERAVSLAPRSALMRYHLAMAQIHAGRAADARRNLEAALGGGEFRGSVDARRALTSLNSRTARG